MPITLSKLIYRAMDQLSRLDGSKIFAMSRRDLIAAFGKKEGIRLDSQITISRNNAGKEIIAEENYCAMPKFYVSRLD